MAPPLRQLVAKTSTRRAAKLRITRTTRFRAMGGRCEGVESELIPLLHQEQFRSKMEAAQRADREPNVAYGIDDTPTSSVPKRHLLLWHLQKGDGTQVLAWLRKLKLKVEVSPEHKAPIRRRFRAPSYFRIGLIREPC